ncbi:hypothetical protein [Candidatus Albibeggiatoa sp. nov. NOAA]|uniref:hypothetical protein n=1 Tax=Candidatus Albibeggiatoa sp. nov. NOAA TaxID=3162724 RepID=UPI0032FC980B|nr:hypothetical protein [Thiotrichaceae bacterium]
MPEQIDLKENTHIERSQEQTLTAAKALWLAGEWESLAKFDIKHFEEHPERGIIALLVAAGYQQLGDTEKTTQYLRQAIAWNCSISLVSKVLISGIHNVLGRAYALKQDKPKMDEHFHVTISSVVDKAVATDIQVRKNNELKQLGLFNQLSDEVNQNIESLLATTRPLSLERKLQYFSTLLTKEPSNQVNILSPEKKNNESGSFGFLHIGCDWLIKKINHAPNEQFSLLSLPALNDKRVQLSSLWQLLAQSQSDIQQVQYSLPVEHMTALLKFDKQCLEQDNAILPVFVPDCTLWLKDIIFFRQAETMAISYLAVAEYQQAVEIFQILSDTPALDTCYQSATGISTHWLLACYNRHLLYEALDKHPDLSELIGFIEQEHIAEPVKTFSLFMIAEYYQDRCNKMKAIHYYSLTLKSTDNIWLINTCANALLKLHQPAAYTTDIILRNLIDQIDIPKLHKDQLVSFFEKAQAETASTHYEHGHILLIRTINEKLSELKQYVRDNRKLTLIEIGSTRELVSGQGSTEKLARLCLEQGIHFITVDMDEVNSTTIKPFVHDISPEFDVVAAKGEDYLEHYEGLIDFIFLDAYDFDHGKHSEDRQTRYEKVLGNRINDQDCHQMHLDCAIPLVSKLSPHGIICFDDVWFRDGEWQGKGKTAIPYLLNNGFKILHTGNNAAILVRINTA